MWAPKCLMIHCSRINAKWSCVTSKLYKAIYCADCDMGEGNIIWCTSFNLKMTIRFIPCSHFYRTFGNVEAIDMRDEGGSHISQR